METIEFFLFGPLRLSSRLIFWNQNFHYCIVPGSQILQGHIIILPKRKVQNYGELENHEVFELGSTIKIISRALEKNLNCTSTTIFFQEYKNKKIDDEFDNEYLNHFHVHLIARKKGDFEQNDAIYKFLADHDKDFIRFYQTKLKNYNAVAEQNIQSLEKDGINFKKFIKEEIKEYKD